MGHDFGGACISFAMERHPLKVSKAVFVAAAMLTSGQSALDMFSQKVKVGHFDQLLSIGSFEICTAHPI